MSMTKAERDERRARGALYPIGKCNFCGYRLAPKALWCSTDCAKEHAVETQQNEQATKENRQ